MTFRSSITRLPRNVWVATVTSFLTDVSSEMLVNLIPLYLFNVVGARTTIIGLIEGIAETTASLIKVVSGWMSDRLGARKWLAVTGYGLSAVAKPFLYFAASWTWVLGVRFADRAGKGIRTSPRDALVADSISADQRGLAFGLHRTGDTAGAVLGLLISFTLVWVAEKGALLLERSVFQTVVLFSIVPGFLAVVVLALGARDIPMPSKAAGAGSPEPGTAREARRPLDARFKIFLLIMVLFTLGNSSDAFLVLRAQKAGVPVSGVLGMMILFNAVYTLVSTPAGVLSDRFGRRRLLAGGWLVYALVYIGFARLSAEWQVWGLMALYGVYYGLTEGVAKAFVADLVKPSARGTAYGLFSAAIGLTALPASLIAGVLWQGAFGWSGLGRAAPFYFGAALAVSSCALILLALPDDARASTGASSS